MKILATLMVVVSLARGLEVCGRRSMLAMMPAAASAASYQSGQVFEGGAGGLSKKKPDTGVVLAESIVADRGTTVEDGVVRAQVLTSTGMPVDVSFDSPYRLSSSGISTRDLATGDSAFLVVAASTSVRDAPAKIFAVDGKYGAYGQPTDVRRLATKDDAPMEFVFDALTPSMREVQRHIVVKAVPIDGDVFMLVAGSTALRWRDAEPVARRAVDSFRVEPSADYDAAMAAYQKKQRQPSR